MTKRVERRGSRLLVVVVVVLCTAVGACKWVHGDGMPDNAARSDDERKAVESFKGYVEHHFGSYKTNRRERVRLLGGGWVKQYFTADVNSAEIDVQRTTSLISPYTGKLEFRIIRHFTAFHQSREEAMTDAAFPQTSITSHRHNYAYQDGKWVPKIRQHRAFDESAQAVAAWFNSVGDSASAQAVAAWFDCAEVIKAGPNAGETDIEGCLEEYDDINQ